MGDPTHPIIRDIRRELADMRDDRTVIVAILNQLVAKVTSLSVEVRALRSQFDRFRDEIREPREEAQRSRRKGRSSQHFIDNFAIIAWYSPRLSVPGGLP